MTKKKDGDRGEKDEQDLSFINNANMFLTKLFSLDSIIQEEDLPPLFFCKAVFAAFKLDTPVCNEFNLPKLYVDNDDTKHRILLWRLFQAEALYAVFSRFALTMAEGASFSAKLVKVVDRAASSYRVYYRYYYCGGCWTWRSYAVSIPEIKHVEFQGKDAPNLRVIMNSLLLNVNNQAQTLLDYDSVVKNQLMHMRKTIAVFMNSNFENEVKLIFKSFDKLFNTAKKMGLLMDDIDVVTLELESCLAQIDAVSYDSINAVLSDHKHSIAMMTKEQNTVFRQFEDNGSSFVNVITIYANRIGTLITESSASLYITSINSKMAITEMYREKEGYKKNSKRIYNGVLRYFKTRKNSKKILLDATTTGVLGFVLGKVVDISTRRRVDLDEAKVIKSNSIRDVEVYNNIALELRQEVNELKLNEGVEDE